MKLPFLTTTAIPSSAIQQRKTNTTESGGEPPFRFFRNITNYGKYKHPTCRDPRSDSSPVPRFTASTGAVSYRHTANRAGAGAGGTHGNGASPLYPGSVRSIHRSNGNRDLRVPGAAPVPSRDLSFRRVHLAGSRLSPDCPQRNRQNHTVCAVENAVRQRGADDQRRQTRAVF